MFELGYIAHLECIINITKYQHPEIKHYFTNHRQGCDWQNLIESQQYGLNIWIVKLGTNNFKANTKHIVDFCLQ